jgi:hypothetical protein
MRPMLAASAIFFLACASGGAPPAGSPEPARPEVTAMPVGDSATYQRLAARLRAGDVAIPFDSLRFGFAATASYDPYGVDGDRRKAMFAALDRGDHRAARAMADSALADSYVDPFAHLVAGIAAGAVDDSAAAAFHGAVFRGLLDSIRERGGRTPDSAMVVISVDEEYALLEALGLRREMQGLGECGGRACDILDVVDRSGGKRTLYFDVSIPKAWLDRKFRQP